MGDPFQLSYDALPPGSDLSCEVTADGVTITAAAGEPSERAARWARRRAAKRAVVDVLLVLPPFVLLPVGLIGASRQQFVGSLPPMVFPLAAVFVGAAYLLAWKWRTDAALDALRRWCRQRTVVAAAGGELRVESAGPLAARGHRVAAARVTGVGVAAMKFDAEWPTRVVRVARSDGPAIDLFRGRDDAELAAVAAVMRRALGVPVRVEAVQTLSFTLSR